MSELYPDTEILANTLSGQPSDLQNNDTSAWYTSTDDDTNNELHVGMQNPGATLDGTQSVDFYVRKTQNGNNDPDVDLYLYENGSQVLQLGTSTVTSSSGQIFTYTFGAADVSNGADVEFDLVGNRTGGMSGSRDVPEYGYITWTASVLQNLAVTTGQPRNVDTSSATLVADATVEGYDNADVWFEWGEVGNNLPNTTTTYTISSSQEVTHDLTSLAEATEYEYRSHINHTDTTADTGSIVSFWTARALSGMATYASDGSAVDGGTVLITDVSNANPVGETTTNTDGTWSTTIPGDVSDVHVAIEHDDGTDQYHAESYPYIP